MLQNLQGAILLLLPLLSTAPRRPTAGAVPPFPGADGTRTETNASTRMIFSTTSCTSRQRQVVPVRKQRGRVAKNAPMLVLFVDTAEAPADMNSAVRTRTAT